MDGRGATARRRIAAVLTGAVLTAAGLLVSTPSASAATTATFTDGVLTVFGDSLDNSLVVRRDAAGALLVNGGAVPVAGGSPTVVNTQQIKMFGLDGNDRLTLDESNGALPRAMLFGGAGVDVLTAGSGRDQLFGEAGNDTLSGGGRDDLLFGGADADTLTGGDADDQAFGQAGDDRIIWNLGDDTDLDEGGDGDDTVQVDGGNGAETFTATANGTRVRFDRVTPAPFALDIGTSEHLQVTANGGDDRFDAVGDLAALTRLVVDAGPGADVVNGGNGDDIVIGGDGDDTVDGQAGNDLGLLGDGADTFQWDPGDGSDTVESQSGDADRIVVNGNNIDERVEISANGGRVRLTRNVGDDVLDLNDVETASVNAAGGTDEVAVNDLSGTDLRDVIADLGLLTRAPDGAPDTVRVKGTNGADNVTVVGDSAQQQVTGLTARVTVTHSDSAPTDRITVSAEAGGDVVDAGQLAAPAGVVLEGGDDDDVLIGGNGDDLLDGAAGDDVLIGGPGTDTLNGGPGTNIVFGREAGTDGLVATKAWLAAHARTQDGSTVLDLGGKQLRVPRVTAEALQQGAPA